MKMPITMDGVTYRVAVVYDTIQRHFEIVSGVNAGDMMSGRYEPDTLGTRYAYQLQAEADPDNRASYDAFYQAITDPDNRTHVITLPYGQSTITFESYVISGDDVYHGPINSAENWTGLVIYYHPARLQRPVSA